MPLRKYPKFWLCWVGKWSPKSIFVAVWIVFPEVCLTSEQLLTSANWYLSTVACIYSSWTKYSSWWASHVQKPSANVVTANEGVRKGTWQVQTVLKKRNVTIQWGAKRVFWEVASLEIRKSTWVVTWKHFTKVSTKKKKPTTFPFVIYHRVKKFFQYSLWQKTLNKAFPGCVEVIKNGYIVKCKKKTNVMYKTTTPHG